MSYVLVQFNLVLVLIHQGLIWTNQKHLLLPGINVNAVYQSSFNDAVGAELGNTSAHSLIEFIWVFVLVIIIITNYKWHGRLHVKKMV